MRICIKCKKREGSWWDHLCEYCRKKPTSEKEALEYERKYGTKDILTQEQTSSVFTDVVGQKYNKLSIAGLILSVIAIFGVGLSGLVGFVLGIVALTQIKYTHEKGKGLAVTAVIIGFIWSILIGIVRKLVEAGF